MVSVDIQQCDLYSLSIVWHLYKEDHKNAESHYKKYDYQTKRDQNPAERRAFLWFASHVRGGLMLAGKELFDPVGEVLYRKFHVEM